MTEDSNKKKPGVLSLGAGRPKLELKKPVADARGAPAEVVRQSFSHGRSKQVVVEAKKPAKRGEETAKPTGYSAGPNPARRSVSTNRGRATSAVLHNLTKEEREARARALRGAATKAIATRPNISRPVLRHPRLRPKRLGSARRATLCASAKLKKCAAFRSTKKPKARVRSRKTKRVTACNRGVRLAMIAAAACWRVRAKACRGGRGLRLRGRAARGEEEEEGSRRKPGRAALAPRRGLGDNRRGGGHKMTVTQALSDEEGGGRRRSVASIRRRMERHRREAMEQNAEPTKSRAT